MRTSITKKKNAQILLSNSWSNRIYSIKRTYLNTHSREIDGLHADKNSWEVKFFVKL